MVRLVLLIASFLFATLSFGQGKVITDSSGRKWQVYNHDTIAFVPKVSDIDTATKIKVAAAKEIAEIKPAAAFKDTAARPNEKPVLPIATSPPAVKKKAPEKKRKAEPHSEQLGSGDPITNKEMLGKWQMESTEMADGYYYTYSFLRGNEFIFGNDENEGLNRIISLEGTYYLKKDSLVLYVKQERDLVGGNPELSEKLGGSGWEVKGGKFVKKDLPKVQQYSLPIKPCADKDGKQCIEINSMAYYKLE